MDQVLAEHFHDKAAAVRPRCWCGCAEATHEQPRGTVRRCTRCGDLCRRYIPHSEASDRVTVAHHTARARSDMQVRQALEALAPFTRPLPDPATSVPAPRPAPPSDRYPPRWQLRRMDP